MKWMLELALILCISSCGRSREPGLALDSVSLRRPPGTVAWHSFGPDEELTAGALGGVWTQRWPFALAESDLRRGRERYEIFCQPCHGEIGNGKGVLLRLGRPALPDLCSERLQQLAPGRLFAAISPGSELASIHSNQLEPGDRWRIVAYLRVLQRSQNAALADLPEAVARELESAR